MDAGQIALLLREAAFSHPAPSPALIETHISWVILAGEFVYKIKKPVNFGFLDFSTAQRRRDLCEREVELNRRFSSDIYLDVVAVCADADGVNLCGRGERVDSAVRMRRFDQQAILAQQFRAHAGDAAYWRALGAQIAALHQRLPPASGAMEAIDALRVALQQNFDQCRPFLARSDDIHHLEQIELESLQAFRCCERLMRERAQQGFVRECHGDLHLGNLLYLNERFVAFDCIEFNDALSHIDVASDLAFLLMDLMAKGAEPDAWLLFNAYLERSGDYAMVALLPLLVAYRAMVRGKVALLALGIERRAQLLSSPQYADYRGYVDLALRCVRPRSPFLVIMHGVSGSGKSTVARNLCARYGAIVLRSDVERKRLFGFDPLAATGAEGAGVGIYSADASEKTFARLQQLARQVLESGARCVVDATFLDRRHRAMFADLARQLEVPFLIVHARASPAVMEARLLQRSRAGNDASEADVGILRSQLSHYQPLADDERAACIVFDSDAVGVAGYPELPGI